MAPDGRWVVVVGGIHQRGGMDKANAALVDYLLDSGAEVHAVVHHIDDAYRQLPRLTIHEVPTPAGSFLIGEALLDRRGRAAASAAARLPGGARVVTNGGNCLWPDVVWAHSVHHEWDCYDEGAPLWFRLKNRLTKSRARARERTAMRGARLVIANSERTRRDVIRHFGLSEARVHTIPLGSDAAWVPAGAEERRRARAWLQVPDERPVVAFVGALSHDNNKGFDTLWSAWRTLCARPEWDAQLVMAGGGRGVAHWQREAAQAGLSDRVRFLGFTDRVLELLAGADVLVSPVRYEAYGLNVQEAVCRGVPAIVSAGAGVAEQYPPELSDALLDDPTDPAELAERLLAWHSGAAEWKARFAPFGDRLRAYSWRDMAEQIVSVICRGAGPAADSRRQAAGTAS